MFWLPPLGVSTKGVGPQVKKFEKITKCQWEGRSPGVKWMGGGGGAIVPTARSHVHRGKGRGTLPCDLSNAAFDVTSYLLPCDQTNTCENITFPKLRLWAVNINFNIQKQLIISMFRSSN